MASWQPTKNHLPGLKRFLSEPEHIRGLLNEDQPVPDDIAGWLARLRLLYGVPFNYLVPDEKMLPQESIRFFSLDPNWLEALLDGALSIGRNTSKDAAHDEAVKEIVHEAAARAVGEIRPRFGQEPPATDSSTVYSGFLLRSAVVSGWPGLEVEAYAANSPESLPICRFERLSRDVMLCIFSGLFEKLYLHEPSEGIQFGALYEPTNPADTRYQMDQLRGLGVPGGGIASKPAGEPVAQKNPTVTVPLRATQGNGNMRVIEAAKFAEGTTKASGGLPYFLGPGAPSPLTISQFSVEMVKSPQRQEFVDTTTAAGVPTLHPPNRKLPSVKRARAKNQRDLFGKGD